MAAAFSMAKAFEPQSTSPASRSILSRVKTRRGSVVQCSAASVFHQCRNDVSDYGKQSRLKGVGSDVAIYPRHEMPNRVLGQTAFI
jgi:hypothetical protein